MNKIYNIILNHRFTLGEFVILFDLAKNTAVFARGYLYHHLVVLSASRVDGIDNNKKEVIY